MDNQIVHSLWIGKRLSILEYLTIISFIKNGHKFYLWVYDTNIETPYPFPPGMELKDANEIIQQKFVFSYKFSNQYGHGKGSYAGFSDLFRYALLYKYGGWWTDMDVTCLRPLNFKEPYVFRSHHIFKVVGNLMKCPPKSPLMYACYHDALFLLDENNKNWNRPIEILNNNIVKHDLQQYIRSFSNQDKWTIVRNYLKKEIEIPEHYLAIHWINEEWRRHKINKNLSLKGSLYSRLLDTYNIKYESPTGIIKIIYRFKLTKLYSAMILLLKPKVFFKELIKEFKIV